MESDTVRLRLSFEDRHILNKSQRFEGLKQSWLLLKPQNQKTVSQLSDYLIHIFNLHHACPSGLTLSMDGFVLPPFESTCIFKDKDIICVTKKRSRALEIVDGDGGGGGDRLNILDLEFVDNQPVENVKLLANEEFEKETSGYESKKEEDEDELEESENELHVNDRAEEGCSMSKKRKASKKLHGSKKKKSKKAAADECLPVSKDAEDDVSERKDDNSHHGDTTPLKSLVKKASNKKRKVKNSITTPKIDGENNNNAKSQPQENGVGTVDVSSTPGGTKKVPSRSARRKKAKRKWLREKLKAEREELEQKQQPINDNHQSAEKDNTKSAQVQQLDLDSSSSEENNTECTQEHQLDQDSNVSEKNNTECTQEHQLEQNSDSEDNVVPVVVRPGLIRFEPLGKGKVDAKHAEQQNSVPPEPLWLNRITSKKKGQKWGLDKSAASKKKDHEFVYQKYEEETSIIEEATTVNEAIDFEKLKPYAGLPKEGDIIAYRLIELSSSWTPELSPFRVGKISWYKNESNKVLLVTVPEYPIVSDRNMDEETVEPTSLYGEDGSLEVDFTSLIDARLVKPSNNASSSKSFPPEVNRNNQNVLISQPQNSNEEMVTSTKETRPVNPWEEISEALSAKKAQLSQGNGCKGKSSWDKKISLSKEKGPVNAWEEHTRSADGKESWKKNESSGRRSWSYKALRGSALGPIMSRLRAENGI